MTQQQISRPCGNSACGVSSFITEDLSFGSGELGDNGDWEFSCSICARNYEAAHPDQVAWPFKTYVEDLQDLIAKVPYQDILDDYLKEKSRNESERRRLTQRIEWAKAEYKAYAEALSEDSDILLGKLPAMQTGRADIDSDVRIILISALSRVIEGKMVTATEDIAHSEQELRLLAPALGRNHENAVSKLRSRIESKMLEEE